MKAVENRISFQVNVKNLSDIAHQDAMQLMTIKEDRDFLKAQRKTEREGKMSEVDKDWVRKEKRKMKRKMKETEIFERDKESHKGRIAEDNHESRSNGGTCSLRLRPVAERGGTQSQC